MTIENFAFLENKYQEYLQNPHNVEVEWQEYFSALTIPATVAQNASIHSQSEVVLSIKAANLINAYRCYGFTKVELDPLGIAKATPHPELSLEYHEIVAADLSKIVQVRNAFNANAFVLQDLINKLNKAYSSDIACEFMHIESSEERKWFKNRLENTTSSLTKDERLAALHDVNKAQMFENFLHTKFPGAKRFSVEGLEAVLAAVELMINHAAQQGVEEAIIGMAHRGRLNMLTKVMGKPYHSMFSEFKGELAFPDSLDIPGDVKYHQGFSSDKKYQDKMVHLSLLPNPSHLEVVNAVALGKVRAKQDRRNDAIRSKVIGLLLHGDAAFAGQGSVMEALALSGLEGYQVGGTIHIVTNNQVGFTTNPTDSRSTNYCTDIAKFISAPILHVCADNIEAVLKAAKMAIDYRQHFKKDIVVDIVGYRKYGHNEGDEPFYTQPLMYENIKRHDHVANIYAKQLEQQGLLSTLDFQNMQKEFKQILESEFELSSSYKPQEADWLRGDWENLTKATPMREEPMTGLPLDKLRNLGVALCHYPSDFSINSKLAKQLDAKKQMIIAGEGIDWATAEGLAYASLLAEGFPIRITGQDVERGTFSHRHAVFTDQVNQKKFTPLNHLTNEQKAKIEIKNSNLSEFGVLAFEYGYSITAPNTLTIWEAQFGDFANGAQVVIDQYITSAEAKWLRLSGLVMLLPHGYEGQGPEHSSARPERFLQLCAKDNIQVVNCSTPASFFHVLRRQLHSTSRKPLVVMSPKSLLRHKHMLSSLVDMAEGTKFQPVLCDDLGMQSVKKVVLCTGKVYYDLLEQRKELARDDIAFIRLEQLYPFPSRDLGAILAQFPNADIYWCQEEHENMGYFYFVEPRIERVLKKIGHKATRAQYIGRERSASPAVGYMRLHLAEQKKFFNQLFD